MLTIVVLAFFWLLSRNPADEQSTATTCVGCEDTSGNSAPSTTEYEPFPPLFVGVRDDRAPVDPVSVATAPGPRENEVLTTAHFTRINDPSLPRCSTMLAPEGILLTVLNVDNGQSTECTNTQGIDRPSDIGIVLHTDVFAEIGDLADAPLPVRISWEDEEDEADE